MPTRFHQEPSQLTPDAQPLWRQVQSELLPPGKFRIDLYAVVQDVLEVDHFAKLQQLAGEHILSQPTVEQRFNYRYPGLFVLVVRIHRIPVEVEIETLPTSRAAKAGWSFRYAISTNQACPILADADFARSATNG